LVSILFYLSSALYKYSHSFIALCFVSVIGVGAMVTRARRPRPYKYFHC